MIKLIGIDCDDTILDSNKDISLENCLAVSHANQNGIKCVLTTGRPFVEKTIEYYKKMHIYEKNQYFIAYNGAAIYDVYREEEIFSCYLSRNDILEIHSYLKQYNKVSHYIHQRGSISYDVMNEYTYLEKTFNNIDLIQIDFENLPQNERAYKYMVSGEPEVIKKIYEMVPQILKDKYNVVISMPCFLEFMNKDVSKWKGLTFLANYLKISSNEIMAIGDSMNDYEMIKNAKIGVAMDNSLPEIKNVASYITDTNENNGVSQAIEKLLKGDLECNMGE